MEDTDMLSSSCSMVNDSLCEDVSDGNVSCETSPVNLVTCINRHPTANADSVNYASYASRSESRVSTSTSVSLSTAYTQPLMSSQRSPNDHVPVNLAAYTRQPLQHPGSAGFSTAGMSSVPVNTVDRSSVPFANNTLTNSSAMVAASTTFQPSAHAKEAGSTSSNTPMVDSNSASAYPHNLSVKRSAAALQAGHWQPALSPETAAQLVATAVQSGCDGPGKDTAHNPLLLQIQTAQLQALLQRFPATQSSSAQCQPSASPATAPQRRQFACGLCGKLLSSQHNLRLHEATIHRGLFQFHCPICNKGLRQERDLRGHMANRHDWKKEFRCSICGHEFGYKRNLKHHVMSHHGRPCLDV